MARKNDWSKQELESSVMVYLEMLHKQENGESFVKKQYYDDLSKKHGRTSKAFEYRMQNISYVMSLLGRDWVDGLLPAKNVGTNVVVKLEAILSQLENRPFSDLISKSTDKRDALTIINKEISKDNFGEAIDDDIEKYQMLARKIRKGQPKFRKNLLKLYSSRCVITNCEITEVLEEAHIERHAETGINHSSNGLLLRSDIHSLFDSNKIKINPDNYTVEVDENLRSSDYWQYNGKKINQGLNGEYPNKEYLVKKYKAN